MTGWAHTQK